MKKFINIYNESISAEKELENSTELKDENIQNESLGKLAKTLFKGNKSNATELKKTILSALKSFNFRYERGEDGGKIRNKFAKGQGDYEIYITVDNSLFDPKETGIFTKDKYCDISMRVVESANSEETGSNDVKVKFTWTLEEVKKALDEAYYEIADEHLDDSYREIKSDKDEMPGGGSGGKRGRR